MINNLKVINKEDLINEVKSMADREARLVVMTCVDLGNSFEISYYFSILPSLELEVLRLTISENEELPSITGIYLCALINENEIKEFYGVKISGLAVDYNGHLFLSKDSPETPMRKPKKEVQ